MRTDDKAPPAPRAVGTGGPTSRPRDDCVFTPRVGDMLWESWMSRACPVDMASLVREMYITCDVESENSESKELSSHFYYGQVTIPPTHPSTKQNCLVQKLHKTSCHNPRCIPPFCPRQASTTQLISLLA